MLNKILNASKHRQILYSEKLELRKSRILIAEPEIDTNRENVWICPNKKRNGMLKVLVLRTVYPIFVNYKENFRNLVHTQYMTLEKRDGRIRIPHAKLKLRSSDKTQFRIQTKSGLN